MQDCGISSANALEIQQSCTEPAIYCTGQWHIVLTHTATLRHPCFVPSIGNVQQYYAENENMYMTPNSAYQVNLFISSLNLSQVMWSWPNLSPLLPADGGGIVSSIPGIKIYIYTMYVAQQLQCRMECVWQNINKNAHIAKALGSMSIL